MGREGVNSPKIITIIIIIIIVIIFAHSSINFTWL